MKTHVIMMLVSGMCAPVVASIWWPLAIPLIAGACVACWKAGR